MTQLLEREAVRETTESGAAGSLQQRVRDLVAQVERGEIVAAIHEFYADDVVMQENGSEPTVGKAENLLREQAFVDSIAAVHENRVVAVVVDGDRAAINWVLEYTTQDGARIRLDEISLQTWRDGRIVHERFFYNAAG